MNDKVLTILNRFRLVIVELRTAVRRIEWFGLCVHLPERSSRIGTEQHQTTSRLTILAVDDVIDIVTHSRRACGKHTADHRLGSVRRFTLIDLHMIRKTLITDDLCHTSRELPVNQVVIDRIKDRLNAGATPDLMKWV